MVIGVAARRSAGDTSAHLRSSSVAADAAKVGFSASPASPTFATTPGDALRVLLVEDEDQIASAVADLLDGSTRARYVIERVATATAATARLAAESYDVLVLDVRLPDGDGIAVLARARAAGVVTPAVVLTSAGSEDVAARAVRAGAQDYLATSAAFLEDVLDRVLAGLVARARGETAPGEAEARLVARDETARHSKEAEDQLLRHTRRLRLLLDVASTVGPALTLGTSLDDALRTLVEALPETDTAALLLHDVEADELVPRAFVGVGDAYGHIRLRPGEGISGLAFQQGQPIRAGGGAEALALHTRLRPENARLLQEATGGRRFARSVSVPLRTPTGDAVGVLTLGSNRADFTDDDLRVLEGTAGQLAVALDNARLYAEVHKQADELRASLASGLEREAIIARQAEERRLLNEFARVAGSSLDLPALLDRVTTEVLALAGGMRCRVVRHDPDADTMTVVVGRRTGGEPDDLVGQVWPLNRTGVHSDAIRSGRTATIVDMRAASPAQARGRVARGVRSLACVPISIGGTVWGTLNVAFAEPGRTTPECVALLEGVAAHLALAIHNAQLYEDAQREIAERTAAEQRLRESSGQRVEAAERLASTLGAVAAAETLEDALRALLAGAHALVGGYKCVARLLDPETGTCALHLRIDEGGRVHRWELPVSPGPGSFTALLDSGGAAVLVEDYWALASETYPHLEDQVRQGSRSALHVPVDAGGQRIGTLQFDHREPGFYSREHLALAVALASQAGSVIARTRATAQLRAARDAELAASTAKSEFLHVERRRADQAERLVATLGDVGAATSPEHASHALLRGAVSLLGGFEAIVQLFATIRTDTNLVIRVDERGEFAAEERNASLTPGGFAADIAAGGPAVLIDDFGALDASYPLREKMLARGARGAVVVPIVADDRPIGSLHVHHRDPGYFGPMDLALAEALAVRAGAGIERIRLEHELRREREELRRREQQLAEAQRLAHVGSWEWQFGSPTDHSAMPVPGQPVAALPASVVWSDELYRVFGLEPQQVAASYEAFISRVHPSDRAQMRRSILRSLRDGSPIDSRFRIVRPDGEERFVHARATAERQPDGRVAVSGCLLDVTEHTRDEAQLRVARDAALAASTAKSDFLANMSHEIRTPMNAIIGMAELLAESPLTPEQDEYVRIFRRNGENLLTLINDILDLSKVESGQFELEHAEVDLAELTEGTAGVLAVRAHAKGLELLCDVRPDVPLHLVGDAHRLRQVLINLLGNAIKFTERGEVGLRVERVAAEPAEPDDKAAPGGAGETSALRFSVWDTGIGIPAEKQGAVFENFTQADSSTTRNYGGTGLGLAISKRLVEMMGGTLTVVSEAGTGSIFSFTARFGVLAPAGVAARRVSAGAELRGERVLVVDDNAAYRLILRETLLGLGALLTEVEDGESALAALASAREGGAPFRLVLLDRKMPGMDGFEVAQRLKQDSGTLGTAIIMLTSDRRAADITRARRLGMSGYLVKPIRRGDLLASIAAAMHHVPPPQPLPAPEAAALPLPAGDAHPLRLLLAEDSEDNRTIVQLYLKRVPCQLDTVEDGQSAVERVQTGAYDLVLMDVQMPVMDGIAATRAIRAWEQHHGLPPTPIVALTANAMENDVRDCLEAGCTGHVAKPVKKQVLLDAIERFATRAALPAGAA